jgi:hypothetical protein
MTNNLKNNQTKTVNFIKNVYEALAKNEITQIEADFLIMVFFKNKIDTKIETTVNKHISNEPVNFSNFTYGTQPA